MFCRSAWVPTGGATSNPRTTALVEGHKITVRACALTPSGCDEVLTQPEALALIKPQNYGGGIRVSQNRVGVWYTLVLGLVRQRLSRPTTIKETLKKASVLSFRL